MKKTLRSERVFLHAMKTFNHQALNVTSPNEWNVGIFLDWNAFYSNRFDVNLRKIEMCLEMDHKKPFSNNTLHMTHEYLFVFWHFPWYFKCQTNSYQKGMHFSNVQFFSFFVKRKSFTICRKKQVHLKDSHSI